MTEKEKMITLWVNHIIPAVFLAEAELHRTKPEWKEKLKNVKRDEMTGVAREYCKAIAEIIVSRTYGDEEK